MSIATAWNAQQAVKATRVRQEIADALVGYLKDHPDATRLQCAEEVFRQTGHRYSVHSISRALKLIGVNFKVRARVDAPLVFRIAGPGPWPKGTVWRVCREYEAACGRKIDDSSVGRLLRTVGYTPSRPTAAMLTRDQVKARIAEQSGSRFPDGTSVRHRPFKLPTPLRMAAIIGRARMGVWDAP